MARIRTSRLSRTAAPCKFGAHMSIAGGYHHAVEAAHAAGFTAVQLFTKNNNQWRAPALTDPQINAFRQARRDGSHRPGRSRLVPDQPGQP